MPKKQPAAEPKVEDKKEEEVEDPPIIKTLKAIDDEYLAVEREFEKEQNELIAKYTTKRKPILEKRAQTLAEGDEKDTGTPAVKGFWLQALENHPAMEGEIEKYDRPILEYLKDILAKDLDEKDPKKGFRLTFVFAENPYFENASLSKEYHTEEESPYTGELVAKDIRGTTINWKDGKDVTFELVQKKVKGGGAKKKKAAGKATKEPRPSFFRSMFRDLKVDGPLPEDIDIGEVAMACGADEDDLDESDCMKMIMDNDLEVGSGIQENIIPWAVRWYTGEAAPDRDDDDGDEDEEESDEDDDDEEDDSEDEPPKGKKGGKKGSPQTGPKKSPKTGPKKSPNLGPADGKQEECKQQ